MKIQLLILVALFTLSSCKAGSGDGLDNNGRPFEESPSAEAPSEEGIQPNLKSIQELVFTPICSTCHGGANPAAGQDLSSLENSMKSLINVDSSNLSFKRVLPGFAKESYLYLKITGDNRAGARMPLGQPVLDEQTIAAIKQWIDEGAVIPQSIVGMTKISRAEDSSATIIKSDFNWQEKDEIKIVFLFSKKMDFQHLTADQILVNAIKKDDLGSHVSLVPNENISLHVINDQRLQVIIKNVTHSVSQLSIQLNESSIATMLTQQEQILDGDNDGIEGGVFTYEINL